MSWITLSSKLSSKTLVASAFVFAAGVLLWTGTTAGWGSVRQNRQKKILNKIEFHNNEPIQILEVATANKTVKLGEQFEADSDWLNGVHLRFKNVSHKDVVYIEIHLNFPETKSSGNEMSFRTHLGNWPGMPIQNPALFLPPSGEVTFKLDHEIYKALVKFVESRHRVSEINSVEIKIAFVAFADGTGWRGGNFLKQDPNNPSRYIPFETKPKN